jgi:dipeptidyl aminopeptidase/acylaminoacyl peptidase
VQSAVFSTDGKLVATASNDKTARIWDGKSGTELFKLEGHSGYVSSAVFSTDGKFVLTASWDKTARIWEVKTGKQLHELKGHNEIVFSAVFSPNSQFIVTASFDETARIWDANTGKELLKLKGHSKGVRSAVFSPDGKFVATASLDETARIWDAKTGKELMKLEGHTGGVRSAVFSPDGKFVATASIDGTACIWDAKTGKELLQLEGHTNWVNSVVFSSDGKLLATASSDKTTWIGGVNKIAEIDGKAKEEARYLPLDKYLKNAGFNENELVALVVYGTKVIQNKDGKGDAFDQIELNKEAFKKQDEIKKKKFVLHSQYVTTNINVEDDESSVDLVVQLEFFANKLNNHPNINALPKDRTGYYRFPCDLLKKEIVVHRTDVGEKNEKNGQFYRTRSAFLKKDGKIQYCKLEEVNEILSKNGVIYWEETMFTTLRIHVTGDTEIIKQLVKQKNNYAVKIKLTNLCVGRPVSHGWFKHTALEEFESTDFLREIQAIVNHKLEKNEKSEDIEIFKQQPAYFITAVDDDVKKRVMADIVDIQIVER